MGSSDYHFLPCETCFNGQVEICEGLEGDSHYTICPDCQGQCKKEIDALECDCKECQSAYFVVVDNTNIARFIKQEDAISYAIKLEKDCVVMRGSGEPVFEMRLIGTDKECFLRHGQPYLQPFS